MNRLVKFLLRNVPLNELSEYIDNDKLRRGLDEAFNHLNEFMIENYYREGFKTTGSQPQVMNILSMSIENLCKWYDGTMKPRSGHNGDCTWTFDGQIWSHL